MKRKDPLEFLSGQEPEPPPLLWPFRHYDRCPKCLASRMYPGLPVERFYREWIQESPSGQYLKTKCPMCFYTWNEQCADAQKEKAEPS